MKSLVHILHKILSWFSIVIFVVLILDVSLGVGSRYILGGQFRWTEELAVFLLVWLVFCGGAIAYHDKAHLGIDLLMTNLHPEPRKWATLFAHVLVLLFVGGVMVYGGTLLTLERLDAGQMMSTLGIHKAWLYLSVPLNGIFMSLFNLQLLYKTITGSETQEMGEMS